MNASVYAFLHKTGMVAKVVVFAMLKYKYAIGGKHSFVKNEIG
jgi:hypothetical protein